MRRRHEIAPDARRQPAARDLVHRRAVIVADPNAGHEVPREAHEKGVAEGLAGARLAGGGAVGEPGRLAGSLLHGGGQQVVHGCHHAGSHGFSRAGARPLEHARNLPDAIRNDAAPAIGEGGVGPRQFDQPHPAGAERDGEVGRQVRGDSETAGRICDTGASGPIGETDGRGVQGLGEGLPHGDGAPETTVEVLRRPAAHIDARIGHDVVRLQAALQGRQVNEQLEGGPRLAKRLRRAVELAFAVIPAAHHGPHRAVRRHRDQCGLRRVRLARQRGGDRLGCEPLQAGVEGRGDAQVPVHQAHAPVDLRQHPVGEIAAPVRRRPGPQGGACRRLRLLGRDEAGLRHRLQHKPGPFAGAPGIGDGRQPARRFQQAGQHGGFPEVDFLGRLGEEAPRGGIDAIGS